MIFDIKVFDFAQYNILFENKALLCHELFCPKKTSLFEGSFALSRSGFVCKAFLIKSVLRVFGFCPDGSRIGPDGMGSMCERGGGEFFFNFLYR